MFREHILIRPKSVSRVRFRGTQLRYPQVNWLGVVVYPLNVPDLPPLDFFSHGHLKSIKLWF